MRIINLDETVYLHNRNDFTYFESEFFHRLLSYNNKKSINDESYDEHAFKQFLSMFNNFQLTKERVSFDSLKNKISTFLENHVLSYIYTHSIIDKGYYLLVEIYHKGYKEIPEKQFIITGLFSENDLSLAPPITITDECAFQGYTIAKEVSHQNRTYLNEAYSEEGVIDCIAYLLGVKNYRIDTTSFCSYFNW